MPTACPLLILYCVGQDFILSGFAGCRDVEQAFGLPPDVLPGSLQPYFIASTARWRTSMPCTR